MSTEADSNENELSSPDAATEVVEARPDEQPATHAEPLPVRRGGGRWLALIALFGVLALAAGAVYWVRVLQPQQHGALAGRLADLEAKLERETSVRTELRAALDAANAAQSESSEGLDAVRAEQQQLREQQQDLFASVDRLQEERAPGQGIWEMREVEELLLVAGQRLTLQRDVATALAALETADRRIQGLADPSWNALRRQLAAEMNALRGVGEIDVSGMALYLADQLQRADQLPLRDGDALDLSTSGAGTAEQAPQGWRRLLAGVWQGLRKMVVIKDRQVPDYVAFDPQLRYLLQHSLRIELANARLAVLNRDTDNLRASAALIEQLLNAYFDSDAPAVGELSGRMAEYAKLDLNPELPDISASLRLLRERRPGLPPSGAET